MAHDNDGRYVIDLWDFQEVEARISDLETTVEKLARVIKVLVEDGATSPVFARDRALEILAE